MSETEDLRAEVERLRALQDIQSDAVAVALRRGAESEARLAAANALLERALVWAVEAGELFPAKRALGLHSVPVLGTLLRDVRAHLDAQAVTEDDHE
jgi:hypothetical protein